MFLDNLFTNVLAVLLHTCPSAEHRINSVTDFSELIKCALESGGHSVLFESLSLMGGGVEAVILSCYQGSWQVIRRGRGGEVSRRKRRQISGCYFAREKLKSWENKSINHLSSECSDSEVEVGKVERVPGVRYDYGSAEGGSEGLSLNAHIGSDTWVQSSRLRK